MMSSKNSVLLISCVLSFMIAGLFGAGCESSFEPLQENDQYAFSMYGTLDLHADTQWVRVMPIGETLIPANPEPNNLEVTLTRERTGETTVLNDSLFVFGDRAYVWNYWTTMSLHPNEEFTLRAEAPDGRNSTATVTTPSRLPLPLVTYSDGNDVAVVRGMSAEPLVQFDTRFIVEIIPEDGPPPEVELVFSHLDEVFLSSSTDFRLTLDDLSFRITGALDVREGEFIIKSKELRIAMGSKDWPDLSDLSEEEIVLPDVVTNVKNGTGFIAGIASRRVPLKSCYDGEGELTPCEELD